MPRTKKAIIRQYKRKVRKAYNRAPIAKQLTEIIANRQLVKMNFGGIYPLTNITPGSTVTAQFRANSIFAPTDAKANPQPTSYIEWSNYYHHYFVVKSKIIVDFTAPPTLTASSSQLCSIRCSTDAPPSNIPLVEMLTNKMTHYGTVTLGRGSRRLTENYSAKKLFNKDPEIGVTLGALFDANPAEDVWFFVTGAPFSTGYTVSMDLVVRIEYTVMLFEPRTLPRSGG